jgi:hypothetical protein
MDEPNAIACNAELWSSYFAGWLPERGPAGPTGTAQQLADEVAARIASGLALVLGGPIAYLYHTNRLGQEGDEPR